ncbi:hypothetical protein HDV05_007531 [Chytridiales sp. JEL 0842]|nr:hypothetical protein HDV05_007531 [Chytridiales sp. JEL 0842]
MIRPRGGDFCYSDLEFQVMKQDLLEIKKLNVAGVVFGILLPNGTIDVPRTRELVQLAQPLQVTFHRAFDVTRDPLEALETLVGIGGIQRVLTSGQDSSAWEGVEVLKKVVERAKGRIQVLPGGGVTPRNVKRILAATGVPEVHMAIMKTVESPMTYRNPNVFMGLPGMPEYSRPETDGEAVRKVVELLANK